MPTERSRHGRCSSPTARPSCSLYVADGHGPGGATPLRDVQEAASHADPRSTMRYDVPGPPLTGMPPTSPPPSSPEQPGRHPRAAATPPGTPIAGQTEGRSDHRRTSWQGLVSHTLEMSVRSLKLRAEIRVRPGHCWLYRRRAHALCGGSPPPGAGASPPTAHDERPAGCRRRESRGATGATPGNGASQRGADFRPACDQASAAHPARHAVARRGTAQNRL